MYYTKNGKDFWERRLTEKKKRKKNGIIPRQTVKYLHLSFNFINVETLRISMKRM